jgi:hypothetical protein
MKTEAARHVFFLLIVGILVSCAPSKGYLDLAWANAKPGLDMYSARLGILPLRSYPESIGSVISVTIGNELRGVGIEITEAAAMVRMLREQNISPLTATDSSDYQMIGGLCNVDYLLVGQVVVTIYSKTYVRTGVASVDFVRTTAQIVDTTTGEVVLSAGVQRPPKEKWHQSDIIGEALATAIKEELIKYKRP